MSNRRVKSLAVDDDDYEDDYEEDYDEPQGEELTDEDKQQMQQGAIKVREGLGPAYNVSDKDIQEALWHYYYDVGKSVSYLKNQHKPAIATTTTQKQTPSKKNMSHHAPSAPQPDIGDFFHDCPWLQIPAHRHALIIEHPALPRLRLLGGGPKDGKMSKLAALAAKRRQQEASKSSTIGSDQLGSADDYAETLNKLRISQTSRERSKSEQSSGPNEEQESGPASNLPFADQARTKEEAAEDRYQIELQAKQELRAGPSAFASLLAGPQKNVERNSSVPLHQLDSIVNAFDFSQPSPDDIIDRAQTGKATTTPKSKMKDPDTPHSDLSNGVADISIKDTARANSKNLDVVAEYKKIKRKNAANFVVIGHVDAGKSTLMGRLLFDLKAIDERTMERYKQEAERMGKGSFAFAWVLDQGTEERERGVTIDIAMHKFDTEKTSFTILDAPGHRDFVPNMIAGASEADFALLVIDASVGEFESGMKGQTKEHALLVRSMGTQRIIVAVNKMDAAHWSKARFDEIQQQTSAFLISAGFQAKNLSFVPCSGLEGDNILNRTVDKRASWYKGSTLVEELDKSEPTIHAIDKPSRMTIGDVFRGSVQNPLSISGRIEVGNLQIGDATLVMPASEVAYIKGIEVDYEPQDWAVAGQNVVLHLTDIDPVHLKSGDVLCSQTAPVKNITNFKAKVLAFDHLMPMMVDVHRGRLHHPGKISQLLATLDKSTGDVIRKRPKVIQPGSLVRVVVSLDSAVPLEAPARVIIRSNGETVAAGIME